MVTKKKVTKVGNTNKKKKSTKKKSTAKKSITKKNSTILKNAPVHHYFVLVNGQPIKNIVELADLLDELRPEVFEHHVHEGKNDFSSWIEHIFKEVELANQIYGIQDKKNMQVTIYRHIIRKLAN